MRDRVAGRAPLQSSQHIQLDISKATRPADWAAALEGVEAVINAAGALQDGDLQGVHVDGMIVCMPLVNSGSSSASFISPLSASIRECPANSPQTKRRGEESLMARQLDWVVLRPSLLSVVQPTGGAPFARACSLPVLPELPDTAPIQPVHLDDVVETIVYFLNAKAPAASCAGFGRFRAGWLL